MRVCANLNVLSFASQRFVAKLYPDVGHVCLLDVVAAVCVLETQELRLENVLETALQNAVPRYFAHVRRAELPHLRRTTIFFHERLAGNVQHQRIVSGQ